MRGIQTSMQSKTQVQGTWCSVIKRVIVGKTQYEPSEGSEVYLDTLPKNISINGEIYNGVFYPHVNIK